MVCAGLGPSADRREGSRSLTDHDQPGRSALRSYAPATTLLGQVQVDAGSAVEARLFVERSLSPNALRRRRVRALNSDPLVAQHRAQLVSLLANVYVDVKLALKRVELDLVAADPITVITRILNDPGRYGVRIQVASKPTRPPCPNRLTAALSALRASMLAHAPLCPLGQSDRDT